MQRFRNTNEPPTVILVGSIRPGELEKLVRSRRKQGTADPVLRSYGSAGTLTSMKIVKLNQVDSIPLESPELKGVSKQVPVGTADGSPTMSMRVMTVAPKGFSPYHSHPWEHLNYILAGTGVMVDEGGEETPVSEGAFAFVAPDEKHQFRNTGEVPLQFICLVPKEYE